MLSQPWKFNTVSRYLWQINKNIYLNGNVGKSAFKVCKSYYVYHPDSSFFLINQ